jgi:hypothetical protein
MTRGERAFIQGYVAGYQQTRQGGDAASAALAYGPLTANPGSPPDPEFVRKARAELARVLGAPRRQPGP